MKKDYIFYFKKALRIINLNNHLLKITSNKITTPIGDIVPLLIKHKSNLANQLIDFDQLTKLAEKLFGSIIRLNHVGFCYKTRSQIQEKLRLINLTKQTKYHLYEEPSNDDGLWLFFGNAEQWEKPMIEMLPIEKVTQWVEWKEYWLPNIHIDIDNKFPANKIIQSVKEVYGKEFEPHLIIIDGITYIVRCRLGIIDGVNIFLDLATNARNVEYQRKNVLSKLSQTTSNTHGRYN